MGLIKDIYNQSFYERLAISLAKVLPDFEQKKFMKAILTPAFLHMEWKERMQHTTKVLHQFMPVNYAQSVALLPELITQLKADGFGGHQLEFMFLPDYVATYGLDDLKNSLEALELLTQYISAEFAVRPFFLKYHEEMIDQMLKWSTHTNHHVRRFASEGSRPRLPWAMAIPALKANPTALFPILENLKNDPHEYVRRSVANNLNDITKDHPDRVLQIAKKWKGLSKETDAIIKHACRNLLKQGHPEILSFYGLDTNLLELTNFKVETPQVKIGDSLAFSFDIVNHDTIDRYIRLEYTIYYLKNNGTLTKKVFKISEKTYLAESKTTITRKQSFKLITTKKFYGGEHKVSILVNGSELAIGSFKLMT